MFSSPVSFLVGVTSLFFARFCGFAFHSSSAHPSWFRWLLRDARHSPRTLPTCTTTPQPPQPYRPPFYPRNLILLQPRSLISGVPSRYLAVSMQREMRGAQCEDEHTALRVPWGRFHFGRQRFFNEIMCSHRLLSCLGQFLSKRNPIFHSRCSKLDVTIPFKLIQSSFCN